MLPATPKKSVGRRAKRTSESTFDRIWQYFFSRNEVKLNQQEEAILERWDTVFKLRAQGMYTRSQVVEILVKKYQISRRTAYSDVAFSEQLFCNPEQANKDQKREILSEWLIRGAKKAFDANNLEAYQRLLNTYADVNNLKGEDVEDLKSLLHGRRPVVIQIKADPETLRKQAEALMEGVEDAEVIDDEETAE